MRISKIYPSEEKFFADKFLLPNNRKKYKNSFLNCPLKIDFFFVISTGVAPLVTIWNVYETGRVTEAVENPFWMFLYGSCALTLGFAIVGGRVTQTVGEGITSLSPSR